MSTVLLSKLGHGEKGRIVRIRGEAATHRYLLELGLFVGRTISVEKNGANPQGDLIEIRANGTVFSLEKEFAANIQIEVA